MGCFLQAVFVLGCGLAKTGIQLIMFRAMQGVALSCCLPTAVSIINNSFANGRSRTLGLGFLGAGQPFGFCIGLVLGGLFTDTIGWRSGYYACAAANALFLGISFWGIPKDSQTSHPSWLRLRTEIDVRHLSETFFPHDGYFRSCETNLQSIIFGIRLGDTLKTCLATPFHPRKNPILIPICASGSALH